MHFLIVELKLHADAAVTGGSFFFFLFEHGFFQNGSNFIALASKDPRCAPAPVSRGLKAVKRVLWTSTVTAEVSKLPPGNKKGKNIFPCILQEIMFY